MKGRGCLTNDKLITRIAHTRHKQSSRGAGTDASVFVDITGQDGSSGTRPLLPQHHPPTATTTGGGAPRSSSAGGGPFSRGAVDRFLLRLPDLGPLRRLRVSTDGKGEAAAWHLAYITVQEGEGRGRGGRAWHFVFNGWLGGAGQGAARQADIEASTADPVLALTAYRVRYIG
jgi:hypothetical protein